MRNIYFSIAALLFIGACAQKENLNDKIDITLKTAASQYAYLMEQVPEGRYPKTYNPINNDLETSNSGWWCSGFYPGTLLYLHEATDAPTLKTEALKVMEDLKKEQFNTSTHDLGFMMYCSFGNAQRLDPNPTYEEVLMNSAESLATRYSETVGCIRSWDNADWNQAGPDDFLVIIDNMMNLELLFWATEYSGDSIYYNIAVNHADNTMKNHYRTDYSSYHVVVYDVNTGAVKEQKTNQGIADESAWARGQAWGLYGYVVMYRATKDPKYLEQAQHIADFILNHPNLPEDKIPYWDFNDPNIPDALRDSSAGAIIASALLELQHYAQNEKAASYSKSAEILLNSLLSPEYIAEVGTNGGFLLKHGVGNMPQHSEIDVPLSYGDYYLVEAMLRYGKE